MTAYEHILLLTDLREDCDAVFERAKYLIDISHGSRLSVLHIVEDMVLTAGYEVIPIIPVGDESEQTAKAQERIRALLEKHHMQAQISVDTALSTERGILDYAETTKPDLIVIGRHKRHGLSSLFGATADDILPKVVCDVLVVRLGDPV